MKIEILICDNINEICTGMNAFNTSSHIRKQIMHLNGFKGIVLIDSVPVKFSYSTLGDEGDVFSDNQAHRLIVKTMVPLYIFNGVQKGLYPNANAEI